MSREMREIKLVHFLPYNNLQLFYPVLELIDLPCPSIEDLHTLHLVSALHSVDIIRIVRKHVIKSALTVHLTAENEFCMMP